MPFAWVSIPTGPVTIVNRLDGSEDVFLKKGESRTFIVQAFAIAKYPITNNLFRQFIDAGGYQQRRWWTDVGWENLKKANWSEPRFWKNAIWNGNDFPVVGISWFEAIAFCFWLSEVSNEYIMLPTEQQWQRAAQALPDGRDSDFAYPWGNQWDGSKCNNSVPPSTSQSTTPVKLYAGKGDSPCGVVDMAGNVWEWCRTEYFSGADELVGANVRVMRGGSDNNGSIENFRCDWRIRWNPAYRYFSRGFRITLSS